MLIIGGDFTNFGKPPEVDHLLNLAQAHTPQVLAIAGNCDSAKIDQFLLERGVSLHTRGVRINDIGFFGLSAMPPWMGNMYEFKLAARRFEAGSIKSTPYSSSAAIFTIILVAYLGYICYFVIYC